MQHKRKVHIKQESGFYRKWERNQFLEQETFTLQWDMSTVKFNSIHSFLGKKHLKY